MICFGKKTHTIGNAIESYGMEIPTFFRILFLHLQWKSENESETKSIYTILFFVSKEIKTESTVAWHMREKKTNKQCIRCQLTLDKQIS